VSGVSLTIEGRPVTVAPGTSILEAAKAAGVLIPHYCYHPGLPVAGVCRMCLVDVEKAPKLAPSCATAVAEGMVVHVHNAKALAAREGVLEFLLINHPLDCPICDQAGECELQDYTFQEGRADSRYHEPKRFTPVEDFGGDVLYVPNRCILCTRCVRFMTDIAHDPVLNVSERGDRALIGKAPDAGLTHGWAGNVVDLCPVGALLSKDFLNKARAWELDRTASVCPNCSQGCNTIVETRDGVVVRLRPRGNPDVNQYFLCDEGRLDYRWLNRGDRVTHPLVFAHGEHHGASWEVATATVAGLLRGRRVHVLASAKLSNEALWMLGRLASDGAVRAVKVPQGAEAPLPGAPDLALRTDRAANAHGAAVLGFARWVPTAGTVAPGDVVVVADAELDDADLAALVGATVVVVGSVLPAGVTPAAALPTANQVEEEGTFTNLRGRVQRFHQARQAPGAARPSWWVLADLLTALGMRTNTLTAEQAFDALAAAVPAFHGLSWATLGTRGAVLRAGAEASA
jgi:NADH-quinone oxidoreductase subunit G